MMKIDVAKKIDYWLGIPICFFLNVLDVLIRTIPSVQSKAANPRKILFIKPSEMGAIVLSYPLMNRIKERYPDAELYFLTFSENADLFNTLDIVKSENVIKIGSSSMLMFLADSFKALSVIWRVRFDIVFDLEFFSRFTAILTYLSGAPKRVGFHAYDYEGLYRGDLLTHKIPYNPRQHISKNFLSMCQGLDRECKDDQHFENGDRIGTAVLPLFIPEKSQKQALKEKLSAWGIETDKKIYLINPGEGHIPLREWPVENFVSLAQQLLKDRSNVLVLVGYDAGDGKAISRFNQLIGKGRMVNLVGQTTLKDLLTICTLSEALIANDCGLAHLASLTRIRQYIFFGPESPDVFAPLSENVTIFYSHYGCSPCLSAFNHRTSSCKNNQCLKVISPQEVFEVISGSKREHPFSKQIN